jgi:hypothetical protein
MCEYFSLFLGRWRNLSYISWTEIRIVMYSFVT